MFLSKIWFCVIAVCAAAALTVAIMLPRPADRAAQLAENRRIKTACGTAHILLEQNARQRIDLAASFAQAAAPAGSPRLKLDSILGAASKTDAISSEANRTGKTALRALLDSVKGRKPDFVIILDNRGRVVARAGKGLDDADFGDSMAGYYAIDDALHGYLRDDTWKIGSQLYRIAAAPVVSLRDESYAGAVVLGNAFDKELAEDFKPSIGADVAFYVGGQAVSSSSSVQLHKDAVAAYEAMLAAESTARPQGDEKLDCGEGSVAPVTVAGENFGVKVARLPGEAREQGAFMAVFSEKPPVLGFWGSLERVTGSDVTFGDLVPIGLLLILGVGLGIGLMYIESDRPVKRLAADAVALGQGDKERFDEIQHKGRTGSIARSVNIALDKMAREAKSARRDLDSLLGPAPGDAIPLGPDSFNAAAAAPLPAMAAPPPAAAPKPPPSEFKFGGGGGSSGPAAAPELVRPESSQPVPSFDLDLPPPPPAMASPSKSQVTVPLPQPEAEAAVPPPPISLPGGAPPATPAKRPATPAPAAPPPRSLDDDILGPAGGTTGPQRTPSDFDAPTRVADPATDDIVRSASPDPTPNDEFRKTFDEFVALKKQCGERTESLTYDKFSDKLRKNRASLMAKHKCKSVRFQVYVKDGKAALKATPIK